MSLQSVWRYESLTKINETHSLSIQKGSILRALFFYDQYVPSFSERINILLSSSFSFEMHDIGHSNNNNEYKIAKLELSLSTNKI